MRNAYPLLVALLLSIAGCQKESKNAISQSLLTTDLQLVSFGWGTEPTVNFTYDPSSHQLTDYIGGYLILDNLGLDTVCGQLVYSQGHVAALIWGKVFFDTTNYHYGNNGLPDTVTKKALTGATYGPSGWVVQNVTILQTNRYNPNGQLSGAVVYTAASDSIDDHYGFSYDNNGNLNWSVDSNFAVHPTTITTYTYTDYDNKINFTRAINGFPATDLLNPHIGLLHTFSPNNVGTISKNGSALVKYTYRYNSAGLPTSIIYGQDTVTMKYQQY